MIVDVNAYLSRWPFRRTPCDEPQRLVAAFGKHQVHQAWIGSLDGLFHRDIGGVNLRLAEACRRERSVELLPFGSVNPMLPDWQEDLRRCAGLVAAVSPARVLFGSHLPLFPLESAMLKMREADLEKPQRRAVECENARRLLDGAR
jgi:hypothetical protein